MSNDFFSRMDAEVAEEAEFRRRAARSNGRDTGERRRFKPTRFKHVEFVANTPDLIQGLFPRDGLIVVWGLPKCGKSFWVYDTAMHVARGQPYRGRRVVQGAVVYVACEGEQGLKARTEAYRRTLPEGADPPFYLLTTRLDLIADVAGLIEDICAELGDENPVLIVIDTLNRSLTGSENKPEDMTAFVQAADKLREGFYGAAVVLIHHCGVNNDRPRGFTGLSGAADAQIAMKRDALKNIVATTEFMKDGAEGDVVVSRLVVVEIGCDGNDDPITSCVVEAVENCSLPHKAKPPLSPTQRHAFDLLTDAINRGGEIPPANDHIPPNTRCITEAVWRDYCYRGSISDSDKPEAKQKAFRRSANDLLAAGRVMKWGDWVWMSSDRTSDRHRTKPDMSGCVRQGNSDGQAGRTRTHP
jgi:hypothetical protein